MAYVRTVKTASRAVAVQIVWSSRRGGRSIEHVGSAHDDGQLAALKAAAAERLAGGQTVLDFDIDTPAPAGPLPITSSQMTALWDGLCTAYRQLGFESATENDTVFRDLVLARIIEPTSKLDTIRVLGEVGIAAPSYSTIKRRLPEYAKPQWRQRVSKSCADRAGLEPASLVLYDVSTLYFETDKADGFREPGVSKERRLEPQRWPRTDPSDRRGSSPSPTLNGPHALPPCCGAGAVRLRRGAANRAHRTPRQCRPRERRSAAERSC